LAINKITSLNDVEAGGFEHISSSIQKRVSTGSKTSFHMKKHQLLIALLALTLSASFATHYACKKESPALEIRELAMQQDTEDRGECDNCPGTQGSLHISTKIQYGAHGNPPLLLCGFAKEGNCPTPLCGGLGDVKGPVLVNTPHSGADPIYEYHACRPLCGRPLPFRFFVTNTVGTSQDFKFGLSLRTSNDEFCQSTLYSTIPAGATKAYIITETANGSCAISEQGCNSTE
jgi:hypothetical protein